MGDYSNETWYLEAKNAWISEYGDVPPPWIFNKNGHPLGIGWRMGSGETFLMTYWEWWEEASMSQMEMINYFKKYTPPPRWLGWVCDVIWDLELDPEFDYTEHFEKLRAFGFAGTEDYQRDYEDPKWIELQ